MQIYISSHLSEKLGSFLAIPILKYNIHFFLNSINNIHKYLEKT